MLRELFWALTEFRGESSPISLACVCQSKFTEFVAELTELLQNSVTSLFWNSTLETVFSLFAKFSAAHVGESF